MSGGVATRFLTLTLDVGKWSASLTSQFILLYSYIRSRKEPPGFHWIGASGSPVSGLGAVVKKIFVTVRNRVQFLRLGAMFGVCLHSIAWCVLELLVCLYFLTAVFHSFVLLFLLPCLFYSPFCSLILTLLLAVTLECTASSGWIIHGTWNGNIGCPETSVTNYQSALRNMAEERSFHYSFTYLSLCGSIKTQKVGLSEVAIKFCIFSKTINDR